MAGEALLGSSFTYDSARGEFVSKEHERIAEILQDYDPGLRLMYIPRGLRQPGDTQPYALGYTRDGLEPGIIMYLREDEINETLLARVWMADTRKNDPLLYLEKLEAAQQAVKFKREIEQREEARDMAKFMLRSPLHTINMGNGRKVHG